MKVLLDIDGNVVKLSQICQLMEQEYGQAKVIQFLDVVVHHDQWLDCCSWQATPVWEGTCLLCGGRP